MPIYEYKCKKCDFIFEVLLSHYSKDPGSCTACGSTELKHMISVGTLGVLNTPDANHRRNMADTDDINKRIRQFDPNTLEDIYGTEKARDIYKGAEKALHVKGKETKAHKELKEKFKQGKLKPVKKKRKASTKTTKNV